MNDNEITDIVILSKNLNHNERMALFEYIRKTNEKARKEILQRELNLECLNCGKSLHRKIMNKEIHIHLCEKCRMEHLDKMNKEIVNKVLEEKEK